MLDQTGIGVPISADTTNLKDDLFDENLAHNEKLIYFLSAMSHEKKLIPHCDELMKLTMKDAELGRMSRPSRVADWDLTASRIHPR